MVVQVKRLGGWIASFAILASGSASGATPEQVARGLQLFTQDFVSTPLNENGDGLGPLFNHTSCVACHHAGGVGGAGDNRFNARTFAVSTFRFDQGNSNETFTTVLSKFAPGFVSSDGQVVNTTAMHRRGGSAQYDQLRQQTISRFNPHWADESTNDSDSVHAEVAPQQIVDPSGKLSMTGHVFARNTTSLFGSGLIDMVPESVILQQFKSQQRHPEISGRPATLADGRIGKFGWRANFATLAEFTENACVNELGLQSKLVAQPKDMTQPSYLNSRMDIDNDSIEQMAFFIASLPAPSRLPGFDSQHAEEVAKGEVRFNAVGCALCHTPTLGPANGIYSDLLVHDMGPDSRDYNTAPPFRKNVEIGYDQVAVIVPVPYYGPPIAVASNSLEQSRNPSRQFIFEAPQRSPRSITEPIKIGRADVVVEDLQLPKSATNLMRPVDRPVQRIHQRVSKSEVIQTNVTQEWRTAPLWGLRDSAPYMHDGRAETVLEAISMHGGESEKTRNRFFALSYEDQMAVLAFLDTFVAPTRGVIPVPKDFTRHSLSMN